MFFAMGTTFHSSSERTHFRLTLALLVACAANLALICAWF
jgi:hypothetical protein